MGKALAEGEMLVYAKGKHDGHIEVWRVVREHFGDKGMPIGLLHKMYAMGCGEK